MKLIESLSHMPFKSGDDLYFCHSGGLREFIVTLTPFAKQRGVSTQVTNYQPWQLARLRDDQITLLETGFEVDSPVRLFCNPVVSGDIITFVYNRKLWSSPLGDILTPTVVRQGIYTGFQDSRSVFSNLKSPSTFFIDSEEIETDFDQILRIVPSQENLIITGIKNGITFSLLRQTDENLFRIKTSGQDVYKCCIVESTVFHAVKEIEFETRFIHSSPLELVPYAR